MKPNSLLLIASLVGSALVFYFSWIPDPNIGSLPFFPQWLGVWINTYGNIRTGVPFLILGAVAELTFPPWTKRYKRWLLLEALLLILVFIAESGQQFLPMRTFDWRDIAWGGLGGALGILLASLINNKLVRKNRV